MSPTHISAGNVLDDLGLTDEEALTLKIRAELLDRILQEVERRRYTQAELAEILDEYQPQVSNLLRGKISKFSVEKLLRYAHALQMRPVLTLHASRRPASPPKRIRRRIA